MISLRWTMRLNNSGGYLAQALDSAQGGRAVSQRELLAAFAEQGAAFCYPSALNPSLAAAWLNVDAPELPDAQWFLLAVKDGGVALYLAGTECYRCETAVSAAALEAALDSYQPDGSFFAFEDSSGAYKQAAALSLITPQTALVDAIGGEPVRGAVRRVSGVEPWVQPLRRREIHRPGGHDLVHRDDACPVRHGGRTCELSGIGAAGTLPERGGFA